MSEENKDGGAATQENVSQETQNEAVSRKAYEEVTRDMHKNKQKAKELEMALNEAKAQLKAQEEAEMQEKAQYKELFEKRDAELEQLRQQTQAERDRANRTLKITALQRELGGKVRPEYLKFANLDAISIDENDSIDSETLRNVANDFRKEHGQLIPSENSSNVTGHAPGANDDIAIPVDISKMSGKELAAHYAKLKNNQ